MTRNERLEAQPQQHPHSNQRKQQERAIRDAYRRERKIESYLADDENFPSFAIQLKKMGLSLRDIPADGNCLFRALGDQYEGHSRNHFRHRQEIVKYMLDNRTDFEPFVEDDVPFDAHVNNLRKLGTHAGNDAIVAFAKLHNVNVMIHQLNGKPLLIQGPSSGGGVRQLHIAYHNGDHYSSVRRDGDNTESPADINFQEDSTAASPSHSLPGSYKKGGGVVTAKRGLDHLESEVVQATGCRNMELVRGMLEDCDYDIDATIATLLQTLDLGVNDVDSTSITSEQTGDSGIWASDGTANRIFGDASGGGSTSSRGYQKVHVREDSYGGSSGYSSLGSNRGGGARPKLNIPTTVPKQQPVPTSRQMKDMKKMEKKKRATERHQQRVMVTEPPHIQGGLAYHPPSENSFVVRQNITRI